MANRHHFSPHFQSQTWFQMSLRWSTVLLARRAAGPLLQASRTLHTRGQYTASPSYHLSACLSTYKYICLHLLLCLSEYLTVYIASSNMYLSVNVWICCTLIVCIRQSNQQANDLPVDWLIHLCLLVHAQACGSSFYDIYIHLSVFE